MVVRGIRSCVLQVLCRTRAKKMLFAQLEKLTVSLKISCRGALANSQDKDKDKDKKLTGSLKSSSQVSPFGLPTSPCQVEKVIFEKAIGAYMISEIWFNAEPKTYNNSFFYYNYVHFYFLFMILMGAYIKPVDVWGRRRTTTGPRISFLGGKSFLEKLLRAGEGMLRYVVWCLWGLGLCFLFDICGSMRSCSLFCKWGDSPRW